MRYARLIVRARWWIVAGSIGLVIAAAALAATLQVLTDFSSLLPPSARSVQDLHAIEKRARAIGTAMIVVESNDPDARGRAAHLLHDRIGAIGTDLVSSITFDQAEARQFIWAHRWLYAKLDDLEKARDALQARVDRAKHDANPLYIDLSDDQNDKKDGVDDLRGKLDDAKAKRDAPSELVSDDGTLQLLIVHTAFSAGDSAKDAALLAQLRAIVTDVQREVPAAHVGIAGDVVVTLAEHDAILDGMLIATVVTVVLVLLGLFAYFRSPLAVGALAWSLAVGATITFALTELVIGQLNLATAFLSSIVVGNGINVGIIVTARFFEELRKGATGADALARTLSGTIRATVTATATAAAAYGSLIVTDFRGFKDFGEIAGGGMILCWISAYTVLPACLAVAERSGRLRVRAEPAIGRLLARLVPRRPLPVAAAVLALATAGAGVAVWFLTDHPFEPNLRNLRTVNATIDEESRWMGKVDKGFGQGISGGFVLAFPDRADVAPVVERMRAHDRDLDEHHRLFSRVQSLDDALPDQQDQKLAVLHQIDAMLTPDVLADMSDADRKSVEELRPPKDLRALGDADLPDDLARDFTEADGSRGKLVLAMSGFGYEIWNADDLVRFSDEVRRLDLDGARLGGNAFVFADMLRAIEHDGPLATLIAIVLSVAVVLLVLGWSRHALVVVTSGAIGVTFMLAAGTLIGVKVNFLDFVALPITIGIGIEYAVNLAARDREGDRGEIATVLRAVGGAVALCSYTTIIGYGTLLLSENRAIRSFGEAAILGEITCLAAALVFTPAALLALAQRGPRGLPRARLTRDARLV